MSEKRKIVERVLRDINPKIAELPSKKDLQSKNKILILMGAGSSVPFGIPNGSDLLTSFNAKYKQVYNNIEEIYKKENGDETPFQIEDFIQFLNDFINLNENPLGKSILEYYGIPKYEGDDAIKLKEAIFKHIRKKCKIDKRNIPIAASIYEKFLLPAKEKNIRLQIFTTNYDNVIESVCKELRLQFENGFRYDPIARKEKWQNCFGTKNSNIDIYKIHGSIDWYLDKDDDLIYIPVSENLENVSDSFQTLMIYPVNFKNNNPEPFASLNSNFYEALEVSNEIISIGYSFRDDNILTPLKKKLEKQDSRMLIIDPNAREIKEKILSSISEKLDPDIIEIEELKFEEWIENDSSWPLILKNWEEEYEEIQIEVQEINNDIKHYIESGIDRAHTEGKSISLKYNTILRNNTKHSYLSTLNSKVDHSYSGLAPYTATKFENYGTFASIICPNCNQSAPSSSIYCPYCQKKLPDPFPKISE